MLIGSAQQTSSKLKKKQSWDRNALDCMCMEPKSMFFAIFLYFQHQTIVLGPLYNF